MIESRSAGPLARGIMERVSPSFSKKSAAVNWVAVAAYYGIACAISWPFFWWRDYHSESWKLWALPGFVKGWIPALGPTLAALICLVVFRRSHHRTVSLLGTSPWRSFAFVGVTILGMTVAGIGDDEPHLTGLWFGFVYFVYGLLEEIGWRGFLQDALRPIPPLRKYPLIGLLWGTWHFTTFAGGDVRQAASRLALMYCIWILGSWGIGQAVDNSRSLLVATMLHLIFNLFRALPREKALPVLAISIVAWVVLLRSWKSPDVEGVSSAAEA